MAPDERLLVLHANSGLGNRLCAIATYAAIARHLGRHFLVVWRVDPPIVDTPFEAVFEGDLVIDPDALAALSSGRTRQDLVVHYGMAPGDAFDDGWDWIERLPDLDAAVVTVTQSCMFTPPFMAPLDFHREYRRALRALRPVRRLHDEIEKFASRHGIDPDNPQILGVHVRRTDRSESIETSTDERFFREMDRALEQDAELRFFLATDSVDVEAEYSARFGDRLLRLKKKADASRPKRPFSLESAVVDLYLLARCHDVLGSYASSFSRVASDLRGIRFHQVGFEHRSRW